MSRAGAPDSGPVDAVTRARPGAAPASTPARTEDRLRSPMLAVLVALVLGVAPNEGYLFGLVGQGVKLPAAVLVVVWLLRRWRTRTAPTITTVTVLCVLLAAAVLASAAVNTGNPYILAYSARWLPFLVICAVLIDTLVQDVPPSLAIDAAAAGALVAAVGALYSFLVLGDPRATGPMEDANDLAYVLVSAVPLVLLGGRSRCGLLRGLAALVIVAGALVTVSRGGLVALLVLGVWAAAHRLPRARIVAAGLGLAAVTAAVVAVVAGGALTTALDQKAYIGGSNVEARQLRWEAAARELADHPVLGVGPGGARAYYPAYSDNAELDAQDPVTHNMYVEVAGETGLVGFGLFCGVIAAAFVSTGRAASHPSRRRHALALQGSLLAACTASAFLSEQYYMTLWGGVATAAALAVRARSEAWATR